MLRLVAQRTGVFLDRAVRNARCNAHRMPAVPGLERRDELLPVTIAKSWPAQDLPVCSRPLKTGLGPLTGLPSSLVQHHTSSFRSVFVTHRPDAIDRLGADVVARSPVQGLQQPAPDGLLGDVEPTLGEEILYVSVAEREAQVEPAG